MAHLGLSTCAKSRLFHARCMHSISRRSSPISIASLLDTPQPETEIVTVNGFIRSIRRQKLRSFAAIGDGSSLKPLQALLTPDQAHDLTNGTAVRLTGSWKPSPNPKAQSHELHVTGIDILGTSDPATFPIQKQTLPLDYLRYIPHLRTRLPATARLLRLRSQAIAELTKFFAARDFIQTHTPIITSSDCEGAGEVFEVGGKQVIRNEEGIEEPFFNTPKYLTVSAQLHLEALAQSVGRVWTLSPTFRAEKSDTARHLNEFYMLEAEMNFMDRLDGVLDLVEDMIKSMTVSLYKSKIGEEIIHGRLSYEAEDEVSTRSANLESRWQGIIGHSWPRITYTKAISLLQAAPDLERFTVPPKWGAALHTDHERYIARVVGNGSPVFVTEYPKSIKPFYMLPSPGRQETVQCFDLLVPDVCEIAGGSMREHRLDQLIDSMRRAGMVPPGPGDPKDDELGPLKWYVDLRRWGSVSHGGFGLGFDRLLAYLAGVQNIREMVTFPRWVGRCEC